MSGLLVMNGGKETRRLGGKKKAVQQELFLAGISFVFVFFLTAADGGSAGSHSKQTDTGDSFVSKPQLQYIQ